MPAVPSVSTIKVQYFELSITQITTSSKKLTKLKIVKQAEDELAKMINSSQITEPKWISSV